MTCQAERVAASLFERILDGLDDGDIPHKIDVSTALRHLIEDREIGLRGQNSARLLRESEPPRRKFRESINQKTY